MRTRSRLLVSCLTLALAAPAVAADLETDEQKMLYAIGYAMSQNLMSFDFSAAELATLEVGLMDGATRQDAKIPMEEYGPKINNMLRERVQQVKAKQVEAGEALLAAAAKEEGAEVLPSGVVFLSVAPGEGASPTATDTVRFNYKGMLADGTVFDSSLDGPDPQPLTLPMAQSIGCFQQGLVKMKTGGKAKLTCPAAAAYGDRGSPPKILPGAALVFEVEIVEVLPPASPPAAATPTP